MIYAEAGRWKGGVGVVVVGGVMEFCKLFIDYSIWVWCGMVFCVCVCGGAGNNGGDRWRPF